VNATTVSWGLGGVIAGALLAVLLIVLVPVASVVRVGDRPGLVPTLLTGVHDVEHSRGRAFRWTTGRARMQWPDRFGAVPAAVVVTLAGFPGRRPDQLELRINGRASRHAVPEVPGDIRVDLPPGTRAPLDIAITSLTTRPAHDARDLGVRLHAVTVEHRALGERMRALRGAAGVVLLGMVAWVTGAWAAGGGATRAARWRSASVAWAVACVTAVLIAPTAMRSDTSLLLPAVATGIATIGLLTRAGQAAVVAGLGGLVVAAQGMVLTTWCVSTFVDVPRWDIWDLVPLLVTQEAHGLTVADLWAPHNEHRPLVARAVLLANVATSRWNHWNELALILALTAVHVLVLVAYLRHVVPGRHLATVVFVAGAGTFIATATQWENLLQGWQVALVAGATATSAGFLLLSVGRLTWGRLATAAALVLVGTAGFASCLLGWPLGAVAIAVRRGGRWPAMAAAWVAVGAVVGVAYVHGLAHPEGLPPPAPILTSATALARVAYGTCVALAMPVWYAPMSFTDSHQVSRWLLPAIGTGGLTLATLLVTAHLRSVDTRASGAWVFPALLIAFAAGACVLTAIGRVPLGMQAMTASRYIAFTALFWVGLLLLLTVSPPFRSRAARGAGLAIALVVVAAGMRAWGDALPFMAQHAVSGIRGREALLRADWANTGDIFPVAPVLDERRQVLMRRGLSLYRPGSR
jgi:hypothetical protein